MTDETENFLYGALLSFVVMLPITIITCATLSSSARVDAENRMEKQAIYYGYGEYSKNGGFLWKEEAQNEDFLKDLEFFNRNQEFKSLLPSPLPKNKIDPSQPF